MGVLRGLVPWRAALLVVAGLAAYANALHGPFIVDDDAAIVRNAQIRQLSWDVWSPPRDTPVAGRPLVNASFAINYAVGGLDVRGYHAVNLALLVGAALTLYGIMRRTFRLPGLPDVLREHADDAGSLTALLWLLHPLHTEVVNYVTQRSSALMGLCFLLTLYAAIRALDDRRGRWIALAAVTACCGMASKESMVTVPLIVVLYDRAFVFLSSRAAWAQRRSLYLVLMASWLVLAALMAAGPRSLTVGFGDFDGWTYLLNQADVIPGYLRLVVWPWALVVDYGVPRPLAFRDVAAPFVLLTALAGGAAVSFRRWPRASFGVLAFFILLAPTSSVVPISTEVGAERRMFLPLVPLVALAVAGGVRLASVGRLPSMAAGWACSVACVTLMAGTIARNGEYRSPVTLYQTSVDRRPHGRSHLRLGMALLDAGHRSRGLEALREAKADGATGTRLVLGITHLAGGEMETGIAELTEFLRRHPDDPSVPEASRLLGSTLAAAGRPDEAIPHLARARELRPGNPADAGRLAAAYVKAFRFEDAGRVLAEAVERHPADSVLRIMLGRTLAALGRSGEAAAELERALELSPDDESVRADLTRLRASTGYRRETPPPRR